jgi:hypothetical protein
MNVGRDWDIFALALRAELDDLGATDLEADVVMDRAWHGTTEVENLRDFARGALELLRAGVFPYDRTVEGEQAAGPDPARERGPFDG